MLEPLNPDSWDSEGNLVVPLHGIRIALGVSLLAAGAFFWFAYLGDKRWHEQHPGDSGAFVTPLWLSMLWIALPLVPFIISALLLSTRSEQSKAAGAGIAAGLFTAGFLFAAAALGGMFFLSFSPDPYVLQDLTAVVVFLGCTVWILISAFRIGKSSWGVFFMTLVATLICLTLGSHAWEATRYNLDRQHELQKGQAAIELFDPVEQAQHALASLAGCLILNQSQHPQSGYPSSLASPPPDWSCETKFAEKSVREYTLSYLPVTEASGRVADFHLLAMPVKVVRGHFPLMVDGRGILFSDAMWGYSKPYIKAATTDGRFSEIREVERNIDNYMKQYALADAPQALSSEVIGKTYSFQVPSIQEDGQRLEIKNYAFHYLVSKTGNRSRFALSVQCQSYGKDCLRSYFLDRDRTLHATGQPREATADDPIALDCEESDLPCKDVVWPAS